MDMPRYRAVDESKDFDLCGLCMGNYLQQQRASIASDGHFLYIGGSASQGLVKVGTGGGGTLRGHVYGRAPSSLRNGLVAFGAGYVLFRPFQPPDDLLCYMLDPVTLKPTRQVARAHQPGRGSGNASSSSSPPSSWARGDHHSRSPRGKHHAPHAPSPSGRGDVDASGDESGAASRESSGGGLDAAPSSERGAPVATPVRVARSAAAVSSSSPSSKGGGEVQDLCFQVRMQPIV